MLFGPINNHVLINKKSYSEESVATTDLPLPGFLLVVFIKKN